MNHSSEGEVDCIIVINTQPLFSEDVFLIGKSLINVYTFPYTGDGNTVNLGLSEG